jgi:PIN domain nuclease of toxin-antitoxin system
MILLDTHVVVWLALEPHKLSKRAKDAIRTASMQGGLAIAEITLFGVGLDRRERAGGDHSQNPSFACALPK